MLDSGFRRNDNTEFINQTSVDWNTSDFGKLWCYNLNYFDFLNQEAMTKEQGLSLIHDYINQLESPLAYSLLLNPYSLSLDPYPTSLRIINWIKFITRHGVQDQYIDASLYAQARILLDNLEYHLMGNHLLENGFALLFAGVYFNDQEIFRKAREIVSAELVEQVLPDGGHFELSPMYHQIILDRLLDSINLLQNNGGQSSLPPFSKTKGNTVPPFSKGGSGGICPLHAEIPLNPPLKKGDFGACPLGPKEDFRESSILGDEGFFELLRKKASLMLGWLRQVTFSNGAIPLLNDAAYGIAPSTQQLFDYAKRLNVREQSVPLGASGYRKISRGGYEMILDVGAIGPDYIPGHAHSDTFSFVLHLDGRPLLVDTGTSTYETGKLRTGQRSTAAHNTVMLDDVEQSEVWGAFRVARRAYVQQLTENADSISAVHNGYRKIGATHRREFRFSEDEILIADDISSASSHKCRVFLHFHPDVEVVLRGKEIAANGTRIVLQGASNVEVQNYQYAPEFNRLIPARVAVVEFLGKLKVFIYPQITQKAGRRGGQEAESLESIEHPCFPAS